VAVDCASQDDGVRLAKASIMGKRFKSYCDFGLLRPLIYFLIQTLCLTFFSHPVLAETAVIEGTLNYSDGSPVRGTTPFRIQFFTYKTGGTPLSGSTDGVTTFSQEGRFTLRPNAPEPGSMSDEIWFNLLLDLENDGFDAGDYYIGEYYKKRAKVGEGPFELTVRERSATTPDPTPTAGVFGGESLLSNTVGRRD
jgi:hypothetical protein